MTDQRCGTCAWLLIPLDSDGARRLRANRAYRCLCSAAPCQQANRGAVFANFGANCSQWTPRTRMMPR